MTSYANFRYLWGSFWNFTFLGMCTLGFYAADSHAAWFGNSEDSNVHNSPLTLPIKQVQRTLDKPAASNLGAGFAYNRWRDEFVVSTDQPHRLFSGGKASIWLFDSNIKPLGDPLSFKTDGDLEGVTVIDENRIAAISELGTIYLLRRNQNGLVLEDTKPGLTSKVRAVSSLAYDPSNSLFYTAEKIGTKQIYTFDHNGNLLHSFELTFSGSGLEADNVSLANDFNIAGLQFHDGYLYAFSEVFSSVFKIDLSNEQITQAFGIEQLPECAGLAIRGDDLYLLGDFESEALPDPKIHVLPLPKPTKEKTNG